MSCAVYVESINLHQFRNLADQKIFFSPGLNFIVGRNGHGKSNLLEAIAFLTTARSHRTNHSEELIRWGAKEASVHADIQEKEGLLSIGLSLQNKRRTAYLGGEKTATAEEFVGRAAAVVFSPQDLIMVKGGPDERRTFIDKYIIAAHRRYFNTLMTVRRALRHKNALLRGSVDPRTDEIDTWDVIMASPAATIAEARAEFVNQLQEAAAKLHKRFAPEDGLLSLEFKTNLPLEGGHCSAEAVLDLLRRNRQRERDQGNAIIGPHRDDLLISLSGRSARAFASQGQTRSIVLSLLLAVIELIEESRGDSPIVLLDDVDSELDVVREGGFFKLLFEQQRQVIITGTDHTRALEPGEVGKMIIENGVVKKEV